MDVKSEMSLQHIIDELTAQISYIKMRRAYFKDMRPSDEILRDAIKVNGCYFKT